MNIVKTKTAEGVIAPYRIVKHGSSEDGVAQAADPRDALFGVTGQVANTQSGDRVDIIMDGLPLDYLFFGTDGPPRNSAASNAPSNTNPDTPHTYKESPSADIPHYGDIAAGGSGGLDDQRVYWASDYWEGEMIDVPAGITQEEMERFGGLLGLTVKGDSMKPIYNDGDVVYVYGKDPLRFNAEKLIGKDCAITLTEEHDDAVYLKRLRWPDNRKKGYFNLESLNPQFPTMVDIPIYSALPVRYTKHKL